MGDPKNGISVHAHQFQHTIDSISGYWKKNTAEAVHVCLITMKELELGQQLLAPYHVEPKYEPTIITSPRPLLIDRYCYS